MRVLGLEDILPASLEGDVGIDLLAVVVLCGPAESASQW